MNSYSGVRVVVLGSTGFIGRWVARRLSECGAHLLLPVRDRVDAVEIFRNYHIRGELFDFDILDEYELLSFYRAAKPSVTFNLAGYGIDREERDAEAADEINVKLVEKLSKAVSAVRDTHWPGADIIHAGSAMEYGNVRGDLAEDTEGRPTTLYGKSKLAGSVALQHGCHLQGIKGVTGRLFSVYGPGENPERLLPSLIRARNSGASFSLTEGLHKRDFVYVEDSAVGLLRLGLVTELSGEIVNVATGTLTSIKAFAEKAADLLGVGRDKLIFGGLPTRDDEMEHEPVTNRTLERLTKWLPPTKIDHGIRKTLAFNDFNCSTKALCSVEMR